MAEQPKDKGGGSPKHRVNKKPGAPKTLAEQKIDKNLADRARRAHEIQSSVFVSVIGGLAAAPSIDQRGSS